MRHLTITLAALVALGPAALSAKTPDGQPPSVETVCDDESGAAFGLCNAYCEAMDCDSDSPHASATACRQVQRNFERKTSRPLPCLVTCPCSGLLPLFGAVVDGEAPIDVCFVTTDFLAAATIDGQFVFIATGPPASCTANDQPPSIEITATEELVCRVAVQEAAAAQGRPCTHPE